MDSTHRRKQLRFAKLIDRAARSVIVGGGLLVIVTVVAILVEIVQVAVPLFFSPTSQKLDVTGLTLDKNPLEAEQSIVTATGDEYMEVITLIDQAGVAHLYRSSGESFEKLSQNLAILDPGRSLVAQVKNGDQVLLQDDLGKVYIYQTKVQSVFDDSNQRTQVPTPTVITSFDAMESGGIDKKLLAGGMDSDGNLYAVYMNSRSELWYEFQPRKSTGSLGGLSLGTEQKQAQQVLIYRNQEPKVPLLVAFDSGFKRLAFSNGRSGFQLIEVNKESGELGSRVETEFAELSQITALAFSLGGESLLVGDHAGQLKSIFVLRSDQGFMLKLAKSFERHPAPIDLIIPSRRSKQFMAYDRHGGIGFYFLTNERTLLRVQNEFRPQALVLSTKDQSLLTLNRDASQATRFNLFIPHPEVNLKSLFSKVWYESYQVPAFVWQSTGGSDAFESKMSLIPLIFGTLKATFYAMFLALPIAVFSAIYTSQFMGQRFRKKLKPLVELMASIPSVVIGFLLALWLAPFLEKHLFSFFLLILLIPVFLGTAFISLAKIPKETTLRKWTLGREFFFAVPVLLIACFLAYQFGPVVEAGIFEGGFIQWMYEHWGLTYDQRNSIIVAIGLGFAVIPIIFSISDDSLSAVPANFTASSLALGASRWQTVWRVVLPSASPGIFAASMIGFGRAVGETMIVLMATGNTPIMDWSFFNGMRTLSANIAVEIPEAPVDGSLYRTLFLCAVILFGFTFSINTAAELVRARLRKKYGRF